MTAADLASRINRARCSSGQWSGRCPAHDDRKASLSWADGDKGLVLTCHAGCPAEAIAAALGMSLPELLNGHAGQPSSIVAEYAYVDEDGRLLFQVVRFTGKEFRQRRPDGAGGWIWETRSIRRVLYRLPDVLAAVKDGWTIYLTEGEKDANRINALEDAENILATTNPGGAGKWRPEYAQALTGANVVIVRDKDEPGIKHAAEVAASLKGIVSSVRIVESAVGKDVSDHLDAGLPLSALVGLTKLRKRETLEAVLARPIPQTPWAVDGLLCLGDIAILAGAGGVGKSWISLYIALCLAAGRPLWGYLNCVRPFHVATVDLESRPWEIDQRLHRLAAGLEADPAEYGPRLSILRDRLRLDKPQDVDELIESMKAWKTDILIIDSLRRAFAGDENDSGAISALFLSALDPMRTETGCSIVLLDHIRKRTGEKELDTPDQALRGSTDKYNMSDLVIGAERQEQRIAIYPSKGRHRGAPLMPFLVEFTGFTSEDAEDCPVAARYVGPLDMASDRVQDAVLVTIRQHGRNITAERDCSLPRGEIQGRLDYSKTSIGDALASLKARRKLVVTRRGKEAIYTIAEDDATDDTTA